MPLDRRTLLAGLAATGAALAGCSGDDGPDRRAPVPGGADTDTPDPQESATSTDDERTPVHYVFTPNIKGWREEEGEDGNLVLVVEMQNVDVEPVEGNLVANFEFDYNETVRHNSSFALPGNETATVRASYPIEYDRFRNLTGLNLNVPSVNETDD
jgi:hypothetical protein